MNLLNGIDMNPIKFTWLKVGYCTHPECVVMRGGSVRSKEFPSTVGVFEDSEGKIVLFDTGYSEHFFEATDKFPYRLYRIVTPVYFEPQDCLLNQLAELGIQSHQVSRVIISHFHGDHISGLKNFPQSQFQYLKSSYDWIQNKKGLAALQRGFLPDLIPNDFKERSIFVEDSSMIQVSELQRIGYDVLGNQTLLAIPLPGHAKDQIGLFFKDRGSGQSVFLVADASWSIEAIRSMRLPLPITGLLFHSSREYRKTHEYLNRLYHQTNIQILPNHCLESFELWNEN